MKSDINLNDTNEKRSVEVKTSPDNPQSAYPRENEQSNRQETPSDPGPITNTAVVSSSTVDHDLTNNTACADTNARLYFMYIPLVYKG